MLFYHSPKSAIAEHENSVAGVTALTMAVYGGKIRFVRRYNYCGKPDRGTCYLQGAPNPQGQRPIIEAISMAANPKAEILMAAGNK